jgi:hypothetical protein
VRSELLICLADILMVIRNLVTRATRNSQVSNYEMSSQRNDPGCTCTILNQGENTTQDCTVAPPTVVPTPAPSSTTSDGSIAVNNVMWSCNVRCWIVGIVGVLILLAQTMLLPFRQRLIPLSSIWRRNVVCGMVINYCGATLQRTFLYE